jgi:small subunit ribosomal protein S2
MKQLLEAGVHFGHQTRRWNPKMKRFIFGERNGIYIIDLKQTLDRVDTAYSYVRDLVAGGGVILFVGTKKQTQDPVAEFATACGMPYVNQRWLGGMLTNFQTVAGRVRKLVELEASRAAGDFGAMPKKEALSHERELEKLDRNLGGLRRLDRPPDAIFVIDTKKEHIAVTEANKLHLPVVAVVDTNCDPDVIDYVIPGNDDAIRAGRLMCRVIADAVAEGRYIASRRAADAANNARRASLEATAQAAAPAATKPAPPAPDAEAEKSAVATPPAPVVASAPADPEAAPAAVAIPPAQVVAATPAPPAPVTEAGPAAAQATVVEPAEAASEAGSADGDQSADAADEAPTVADAAPAAEATLADGGAITHETLERGVPAPPADTPTEA